jgi:catechol 2,3-dioxygenase-like lactoylglutathione lyase family enzyme
MEINALTLGVADMGRSLDFYQDALSLRLVFGGRDAEFSTLEFGRNYINLFGLSEPIAFWGRAVLHVDDPDGVHHRLTAAGYIPEGAPADAPWGERYFHVRDPDGHELSFARRIDDRG